MKALKGTEASAKIKGQIMQTIEDLEGLTPRLAVVRVEEKPDDMSYGRGAVKKMEDLGLRIWTYVFPGQMSNNDLRAEFSTINRDPDVSGILPLRPLPKQVTETNIEKVISPERNLSGILLASTIRAFAGDKTGFVSCTTEAVIEVLEANKINMTGKNATIVGRSMVVGRPLFMPMLKENATATVCRIRTRDLKAECRRTEILVVVAGKVKTPDGRHVGQDAIVIDVGANVDENGKICGNADFQSIESMASMATLTPGGTGAATTTVLAKHPVPAG